MLQVLMRSDILAALTLRCNQN